MKIFTKFLMAALSVVTPGAGGQGRFMNRPYEHAQFQMTLGIER